MFLFRYQVQSDFQIFSTFKSIADIFSFFIFNQEIFEYVISQSAKLNGFQKVSEVGIPIYKASSDGSIMIAMTDRPGQAVDLRRRVMLSAPSSRRRLGLRFELSPWKITRACLEYLHVLQLMCARGCRNGSSPAGWGPHCG